jgi:serine/threonine protein kinase
MHELSTELGRFIGGGISLDQLRAVFRDYLAQHHDQREPISRWLRTTVEEGRLSATIWLSLRDLFDDPPAGMSLTELVAKPRTSARVQQTKTQAAIAGSTAHATQLASAHATQLASVARIERRKSAQPAPNDGEPLRPGMVVRERFVLVEQLGSGGMGEVFKARDLRREEAHDRQPFIALKVLNKEVSNHPDSFMALQREARRAGTLAHPNVVTVYDFDRDGARIYMTMEYLEGRGLDTYLREECSSGLALEKAWPIIRGVALALEYGHQKRIVHSDLKPGNIFICNDGSVKVLDFGIARVINATDGKSEETLFDPGKRLRGLTPAYASLEMWNRESPDPRDDIYALACVTYELLSGKHPYDRLSAKTAVARKLAPQRVEALSRGQWEGLRKGLELRREQRSASVSQFIKPFAPQSTLRKYAVPAAVAAVLATAGALAVSARYYRSAVEDSTLQVLQCAEIPRPVVQQSDGAVAAPTPEQQQEINDNLTLAGDYMRDVSQSTGVDDLKYILSDGANSVNDVLDAVLKIDPSHAGALKLKGEVANVYAARARLLLDQGSVKEALDLVRHGRKVLPASQELFRLEQAVCRAQGPDNVSPSGSS